MGCGQGLALSGSRASPRGRGGAAMFYSTLTLRFDPSSSTFDDRALSEFLKTREVLSVREHFFVHGELPHLLLCISWRMPPAGSARPPKPNEDWKELLRNPEQQERFDRLRRWRNETAKAEGKPAYAILTNRIAAEVAVLPAPSLTALREVQNLGPARVKRYGAAILELLGAPVRDNG